MTRSIKLLLAMMLMFLSGFGVLAEAGNKLEKYSLLLLLDKPNQAPVVDPEVGQKFTWVTNSVQLDASVTDDPNDDLVYEWTQLSGAGVVTFGDHFLEDTAATFPEYGGTYLLQLSVSDGEFTSTTEVTVVFNFLENHTNPQQHKLPANRVYPMGQKMMLTAWLGKSVDDQQRMKDNGFSMQGPEWDTRSLDYLDTAIAKGLRSAHRISGMATNAHELNQVYKDGIEEQLFNELRMRVRLITQTPRYNANVDIWLTGVEELSTHIGTGDWDVTVAVATDYLTRLQQILSEEDTQHRPLWMSDVSGVSKNSMMVTHRYLDMVGPQSYLGRIDPNGSGWTTDAVMGSIARDISATAKELDTKYPGKYKRPATATLDALYEPILSRDGVAMIDKIVEHWMYLGFNNGLQGYQFYAWNNYIGGAYADAQTWNWWKDAYYKHVKRLTDYKLDYAYLWGDRQSDLDMKILSGPATVQNYPSISMQNIQYGDHRYVMITNSAESAVQVEVSEFPIGCVKLLDIREGIYLDNHGSINTILQPLDVKLYRFEPVDDC